MTIPSTVLFIDLETLSGTATPDLDLTAAPPGWEPEPVDVKPKKEPTSYKGQKLLDWKMAEGIRMMHAMAEGLDKQRADAWKAIRDQSLDPTKGRIGMIGWALGEGAPEVIDCAEDEEAGLKALAELVADASPTRIVAHNGHGFDFPWIQLRAMKWRGLRLARRFKPGKPWESAMYDTLALWPGQSRRGGSLDSCAELLGIDRSANPISGAEVLDCYVGGRWDDVRAHCLDDISVLREVYRVLSEVNGD